MKSSVPLILFAASCWPLSASAAEAEGSALRTCRAVADATRRLACYDALPLAPVPAAASPAPAAKAVPATAPPPAPAAATAVAPVAAPAVARSAVSPQSGPSDSDFGLEAQRGAGIQQISSRIDGLFEGWGANTRFKLANGQVWQVTDGSSAAYYLKDPQVTVARAAIGSFRLEIEGAKQAPRVRRVQ